METLLMHILSGSLCKNTSCTFFIAYIFLLQIDSVELQKRQRYLRAQRDKLVALKKEVRKKNLVANISNGALKTRPKSSKAAEAVLSGSPSEPLLQFQQLQIRKALVERLRTEVMDKKVD